MLQRMLSRFHRSSTSTQKRPRVNLNRLRLTFDRLEDRMVPTVNVGTIHLTDPAVYVVEKTHYDAKQDVFVYANGLAPGDYDVEVIAPGDRSHNFSERVLGVSAPLVPVHVGLDGHFDLGPVLTGPNTLRNGHEATAFSVWYEVYSTGNTNQNPPQGDQGYDDTSNPGGEYQVVIARHDATQSFTNDVAKSKNFKVISPGDPTLGTSITTTYTLSNGATGNDSTEPGTVSAPLGATAVDTATVIDENGDPVPVGSVTFNFYSVATGLLDHTDNVPVDVNGLASSNTELGIGLGSGDYFFTASYSGGTTYDSSTGGEEPFHINYPPLVVGHTYDCVNIGSVYSAPNAYSAGVLDGASDPDNGPNALVAVLDSGPAHNAAVPAFVLNPDGTFSYTPNDAYFIGLGNTGTHPTDSFTYHAFDGLDSSAIATAMLTINRAPTAVADNIGTAMNVPVYGNVLTNDYDVDDSSAAKDGIHVTAMNGSAANVGQACLTIGGTFLLNSNGSFTYTPNPDFHGTDTFTYQIKDHCGLSSSVSTLIFTVTSGAKTQGYWKTHAAAWPVSSITIAGISYTKSEAIAIMNLSTTGNAISSLWQQLVAAKLNILSGVVAAAADIAAINDAEAAITLASTQQSFDHTNHKLLINTHGVLCWNDSKSTVALVNPSSTLGMRMVSDLNTLTAFNQTGT